MERQFSEPVDHRAVGDDHAGPAGADLASQLAAARNRLAFYESFDSLVQENVRRSGELLRQIAAEREAVERRLQTMQAEVDAIRADQESRLTEQRGLLSDIATGLGELESHLNLLTSRVNQSLANLPDSITALSSDGEASGAPAVAVGDETAAEAGVEAGLAASGDEAGGLGTDMGMIGTAPSYPEAGAEPATSVPAPPESVADDRAYNGASAPSGAIHDVVAPALARPIPTGPRTIDVVIHGVPKAATALSIQRYLQNLAGVHTVEVREYVSGVLRIQVVATSLSPDDFRRWEGGGDLQTVTARQNVLELKLPSAEGF